MGGGVQLNNHMQIVHQLSLDTVMTLTFRTDRSGQTVQTHIRLLPEEQSDQRLHCLLYIPFAPF